MSSAAPVLVIDDGELETVRLLLDDLGVEAEYATSQLVGPVSHPSRLLVTTAQIAHSLRLARALSPGADRAAWIAFVSGDSKTQKTLLQKAGFDFLVREPVHPAALRVLLQRALFRGNDTRRAPRVAFGYPVRYRTGLWRRSATLVDLSPRGCRLLLRSSLKERSTIRVQIPRELAGGKAFVLTGHAVRVTPADREGGGAAEFSVGVRFDPLNERAKASLRAVLADRVIGPAALSAPVRFTPTPAESRPAPGAAAETQAPAPKKAMPRRKNRLNARSKYRKEITAVDGDDAYMILCLDLSVGGMKIEPVEGLGLGSKLNLAIQLGSPYEPVLVEATVVRDEGDKGLGLRFDWLSPEAKQRVKRLVATLPAIEPLQDDGQSQGTILATQLPHSPRPK